MLRRLSKDRVRRVWSGWVHHVKTHVIFNACKKLSSRFVFTANRSGIELIGRPIRVPVRRFLRTNRVFA